MTNVAEAKARLSEYLDRVLAGERIVICRHNRPIAELRATGEIRVEPRPVGPLPGRPTFDLPSSFFEPLPEDEVELWEGVSDEAPPSPRRPRRGAQRRASHGRRTTRPRARRKS
ncbi:MAG: type II toxin-antitoxin system Phd/YefM family antitoxin [Acidobacteriota bacterium]